MSQKEKSILAIVAIVVVVALLVVNYVSVSRTASQFNQASGRNAGSP